MPQQFPQQPLNAKLMPAVAPPAPTGAIPHITPLIASPNTVVPAAGSDDGTSLKVQGQAPGEASSGFLLAEGLPSFEGGPASAGVLETCSRSLGQSQILGTPTLPAGRFIPVLVDGQPAAMFGGMFPLLIQVYIVPTVYRTDFEGLQPAEQLKADAVRFYCQEMGLVLWNGMSFREKDPATIKRLRSDLRERIRAAEEAYGVSGSEDFEFKVCITQKTWYGHRRPPAAPDAEDEQCVGVHLVTGGPGEDATVKGKPGEIVVAVGGDDDGDGAGAASAMPGERGTGIAISGQ